MRRRPDALLGTAIFLVALALGLPFQVLFGHSADPLDWSLGRFFTEMGPLNWAILFLAPVTAAFVLRASPLTRISVPFLSVLIIYNNWIIVRYGSELSHGMMAAATALYLLGIAGLTYGPTRRVLLNSQLRWWLTASRYPVQIPVRLKFLERTIDENRRVYLSTLSLVAAGFVPEDLDISGHPDHAATGDGDYVLHTHDLSESGLFVETDHHNPEHARALQRMRPGATCFVSIALSDPGHDKKGDVLICEARVVRTAEATLDRPAGVGLQFLSLTYQAQRRLVAFLEIYHTARSHASPTTSAPAEPAEISKAA